MKLPKLILFGILFLVASDLRADIQFSVLNYSVTEGALPNQVAVTMTRTGTPSGSVSVNLKTLESTARAGSDYGPVIASLTWGDGDANPKTIQIPIVNDQTIEGPENFFAVLTDPTSGAELPFGRAVILITDDDKAVRWTGTNISVMEQDGIDGVVELSLQRLGSSVGAIVAHVVTVADTALDGQDFRGAAIDVDWADGDADEKSVQIPIIADDVHESQEFFFVDLTGTGAEISGPPRAKITIQDDDNISFRFNPDQISANEGQGTAIMTVERTSDPSGEASVIVRTQGGTAFANQDYVLLNQELIWVTGDSSPKQVFVALLDDPIVESTETINLVFIDPLTMLPLDPQVGTIRLLDNDTVATTPGQIQVTMLTPTTVSENVGQISFQVSRVGGKDGTLTLQYETINGTAQSGFDYTQTSGLVPFPDQYNIPTTISVPILNDSTPEPDKSFDLSFTALDGPQAGTNLKFTVTIKDDDGPTPAPTVLTTGLPSKNILNLSKSEQAEIRCDLTTPGPIDVTIYDRLGREVIHLHQDDGSAGPHVIFWNGRDAEGVVVSAGMYHAVIKAEGKTKKLPIVAVK